MYATRIHLPGGISATAVLPGFESERRNPNLVGLRTRPATRARLRVAGERNERVVLTAAERGS